MTALDPVRDVARAPAREAKHRKPAPARLAIHGAVPTARGIRFETSLRFEEWQKLGLRLGTYSNASRWWLGDWLHFGRQMYGSRYKLGVAVTGLDYKTLRNYAYIAGRIPLSRRRDTLSFQHHAEVAPLSPTLQETWLDRAEADGWSRQELRRRLRAQLRPPTRADEPSGVFVSMQVAPEHPWSQAARQCDCDLRTWVERTLDEAARSLLRD